MSRFTEAIIDTLHQVGERFMDGVMERTESSVRDQAVADIEAARDHFVYITGAGPDSPVYRAYDDAIRAVREGRLTVEA